MSVKVGVHHIINQGSEFESYNNGCLDQADSISTGIFFKKDQKVVIYLDYFGNKMSARPFEKVQHGHSANNQDSKSNLIHFPKLKMMLSKRHMSAKIFNFSNTDK